MSEEKQNNQTSQDGLFDDLIKEAPISSLNISEPGLENFSAQDIIGDVTPRKEKPRRFGKRSQRHLNSAPAASEQKPAQTSAPSLEFAQVSVQETPVAEEETTTAAPVRTLKSDSILEPAEPQSELRLKPAASEALIQDLQENSQEDEMTPEEEALFQDFVEVPASKRSRPRREEPLVNDDDEEEEDDDDDIIDPDASLNDETDYDLYEDRKGFMLSDYRKQDEYLARQARQGYHFVKREGRKYYFHKKTPGSYYYKTLYFAQEPSDEQWKQWAQDGWELVSRAPAKKRKEAGWIVMRQREVFDELHKDIDNEEEKYRFFRNYSSSCRSTMFLLFICMAICAITAFLQWQFKGYLAAIVLSGILFAVSLIVFLMYGRMLRKSKKEARLLKARLRNKERDAELFDLNALESQDELDSEWEQMDTRYRNKH